jgi:glycosyltransferase involved in cell wall biosynthesis
VDNGEPATDVTLPRPIAGVVGQINERLDMDLLDAIADTGQSLLLVGPRYEQAEETRVRVDALLRRPNVQWVGRQSFERVPGYLATIDVGLTPYAINSFNEASFPLKTLEYLAAGRPVVSVDLSSARWLDTALVSIAEGRHDFVVKVQKCLAEYRSDSLLAERRRFARQHSWDARADAILHELGRSTRGTRRRAGAVRT